MANTVEDSKWYHSNKYTAEAACEHCGGVVYHEAWCLLGNRNVAYAYEAVIDASKLSLEGEIILHGLGVAWKQNPCDRSSCSQERSVA